MARTVRGIFTFSIVLFVTACATTPGTWIAEFPGAGRGLSPATFVFLDNGQGTIESQKWGKEQMTWSTSGLVVTIRTADGPAEMVFESFQNDTFSFVLRGNDAQGNALEIRAFLACGFVIQRNVV
jgi:hypothetical protein